MIRNAPGITTVGLTLLILLSPGCGPTYRELRHQGHQAMAQGRYGTARIFFDQAEEKSPRNLQNLYDLATASVMLAKLRVEEMNHAAAMRELDLAIAYYDRALSVHPGHQPSIEGKTTALKLRGQFDEAIAHAEWAAEFVGPAARQYIFLASQLEERGDVDGALLRYRQAVAMEPDNPEAHVAFAKFLLRHDKDAAAVHHLQAAYRLDPTNEWILDELTTRGAVPTLGRDPQGSPAQPTTSPDGGG